MATLPLSLNLMVNSNYVLHQFPAKRELPIGLIQNNKTPELISGGAGIGIVNSD
jgi:hypothetical protein